MFWEKRDLTLFSNKSIESNLLEMPIISNILLSKPANGVEQRSKREYKKCWCCGCDA